MDHGVTGLVVDPDDRDAIVAAIVRLFTDHIARERFGAAGQVRAREVFGVGRFVRDLSAILAPLLSARTAPLPC